MTEDTDPDADETGANRHRRLHAVAGRNLTAAVPSTWKVRGRIEAGDGAGVLGRNTAATGRSTGVAGVTEGIKPEAAGVRGEAASGSGEAAGVHAITRSDDTNTEAVRAEAPNGGRGITATAATDNAVFGSTDSDTLAAITGRTDGTGGFALGIPSYTSGVFGSASGTSGFSAGVLGVDISEGAVEGVRGRGGNKFGGENRRSFGVRGVTYDYGDDSAGVRGETAAGSGLVYGVYGQTAAEAKVDDANQAAGLKGEGTGTLSTGVVGVARAGSGVVGVSDNVLAAGYGTAAVEARGGDLGVDASTDRTGQTYAVRGTVESADTSSAAILGNAKDSEAAAVHAEEGRLDVDRTGVEAYLSSQQGIPDDSITRVKFDTTGTDDFTAFDTTNHVYEVPYAGDYHVSAAIKWADNITYGVFHNIYVRVNGSSRAQEIEQTNGDNRDFIVTNTISKTLFRLGSGDTIDLAALHNEPGATKSISASNAETFLTIFRVG